MRNLFTFLLAFGLTAISFLHAQTVETVATGLINPLGLALNGSDLYLSEYNGGKISNIDISQPLPAPATTLLSGIDKPTGLLVIGNYLYICAESNLPGLNCAVGRVDLTAANLTIEAVAGNVTGGYAPQVLQADGDDLYISAAGTPVGIFKVNLAAPFPQNATTVLFNEAASGMAIKGNDLYFGNYTGTSVKKIDLTQSTPTPATVVSGLAGPDGLTFNGNFLYISVFDGGTIQRIDVAQANPIPEVVVSGVSGPSLVAFDGIDLYFAEYNGGKVSRITINQPVFSTIPTVCSNTIPDNLGGASPTGGTYSGPGVTDNGDGNTFTFNPGAAGGPGTYSVIYTASNGSTVTSSLTVTEAPVIGAFEGIIDVSFPPVVLPDPSAGPAGGVYSGPGILPGNVFDPALAGGGVHVITYTYSDANGCSASGTGTITVNSAGNDACSGATDLNNLFGGSPNVAQTSGLSNNTGYNTTGDPAVTSGCFFQDDDLQHTIWYTFTGDGNTYRIRTVECNATNYIADGDTQVAIFTGDCSSPTQVACNDDEDANNNIFNISVDLVTVAGQTYRMLVDGYGGAQGEFCLEVTNLTVSAITDISQTDIRLFPNPTTGMVQLDNVTADHVQVYDNVGRLVLQVDHPGNRLDMSQVPAGLYFLKIAEAEQVFTARVVKQ